MTCIEFTILGEPCSKANSRELVVYGNPPRPHFIKSKDAIAYERSAILQIPEHARQMLDGPLRFTATLFYASHRKDLDESIVLDVLQTRFDKVPGPYVRTAEGKFVRGAARRVVARKGVYINDRQVREKHVFHAIDKERPRAEIQIEPLEQWKLDLMLDESLTAHDDDISDDDPF